MWQLFVFRNDMRVAFAAAAVAVASTASTGLEAISGLYLSYMAQCRACVGSFGHWRPASVEVDGGDYQPPRIFDDERGHAAAAENERLREQLQDRSSEVQQLREQHAIETEQLRVESEQSKAEVAELRRQLEEDSKQ